MSGHNKWSTIRHKKAREDAKRGKVFTKLIKEITVAARMGGGDEATNPRLRAAIMKAKDANMPNDNIVRAIKKGTGELEGVSYEEVTYEGYGPDGVALLIDCVTDNRKRIVSEVRKILSKNNGKMADAGSVNWVFEDKGLVVVDAEGVDEENLYEAVLEAGAEDIESAPDAYQVTTEFGHLEAVRSYLEGEGYNIVEARPTKIPKSTVTLTDRSAERMLKLMVALEDNDDVQNVWANFDIDDSLLESLSQ